MNDFIRPNKKLLTKYWLTFITITIYTLLTAVLLQILISLDKNVTSAEVGSILWPITAAGILLFWLISVPIAILWFINLKYLIEEDKIVVLKGILTKVQKNIPYRAITDFILHRSLFDRWLGIASIRIQTAGQTQTATSYEGNLAGLKDWEGLHQVLREKVKKLHPISGALATTEPVPTPDQGRIFSEVLEELKAIRRALEK